MVALIAAHIARQNPLVTICLGFSITHQVDRLGTHSIQWDQVKKMEDLWQVLFCEQGVVAIAIAIFLENSQSRGPLVPILVVSLSASLVVLFEHQTDLACPWFPRHPRSSKASLYL